MEVLLVPLLPILGLLLLGYGIGHWRESAHIRRIELREQELRDIRVSNLKHVTEPGAVAHAEMVMGEAVIAGDYFKSLAASLRNVVGGEVRAFDSLLMRARREATVRMLEQARALGATEVWNVRLATSNIRSAGSRNPGVSVEIFAFGTAIIRR